MTGIRQLAFACLAVLLSGPSVAPAADGQALYQQHCAACHGTTRLGGVGPALLPENLERLRKTEAVKVIREGRVATQMPGFAGQLSGEQAQQLADLIYSRLLPAPEWGAAAIRASHVVDRDAVRLPATPGPGQRGLYWIPAAPVRYPHPQPESSPQ